MELDDFFPSQICLNLDSRPDRWQRMQQRFADRGMNRVVRFSALEGLELEIPPDWPYLPGAYGCLRSHLAIVQEARRKRLPSVLIFEDDCDFSPDFREKFNSVSEELPGDWDMLLFGAIHGQPISQITPNIIKVTHSLSTFAYALRNTVYDSFIDLNMHAITVLDENTRRLQTQFNCYCFMPHLAWVDEDFSDVRLEKVNLWWLKESYVLFGPEIDRILQNTLIVISVKKVGLEFERNLAFLVAYFTRTLPGARFVFESGVDINEPDSRARSNSLRGQPATFLDHVRCVDGVIGDILTGPGEGKDFFVFVDSDVLFMRDDIKANLLKCREFDAATGFSEMHFLDEDETVQVINGDERWTCSMGTGYRKKTDLFDATCVITRKGLELVRRCMPNHLFDYREVCIDDGALKVFRSPNSVRRLNSPVFEEDSEKSACHTELFQRSHG